MDKRFPANAGVSKAFLPLILVVFTGLLVFMKVGFIFILVAMLPSLVSYYIDTARSKSAFKTVFACNLAATLQPVGDVLKYGMHMSQERFNDAIHQPSVWLFIYSGAAAGWGLVYMLRFFVNYGVTYYHDYQLYHLQRQQKWLVDEWGKEVVGPEDEDE